MSDDGVKSGDFVIPGEMLGVGEEFMPGEGAYEEDGYVHSAVAGIVNLDMTKRMASVEARTALPPSPKEGDPIICEVVDIKPQMVLVELIAKGGQTDRALSAPTTKGRVYISHSSKKYVTNLQNEFKIGDVIRARIRDTRKLPYELSTVGSDMGVLLGFCTKCRNVLVIKGEKLVCSSCGNVESRKTAVDYGKGNV